MAARGVVYKPRSYFLFVLLFLTCCHFISNQQIVSAQVDPNVDPYGYFNLKKNPDGSVNRLGYPNIPENPASDDLSNPLHLSKDIVINKSTNTWVRLFVPRKSFDSDPGKQQRLPIVVYFYGGGFIIGNPSISFFYSIYDGLTNEFGPAIVVSVNYRLAPEHRLPAAYDNAMEALHWLKNSGDEWLMKYGDVSRCYILGSSSGGNIAYHAGLRAVSESDDLKPLQIKGLMLHQPGFGGEKRTNSELRLANDTRIPLVLLDVIWKTCLPVGANRDHPYCNPLVGINTELFDQMKILGWKVLMMGSKGDPLFDREMQLSKKLEEHGVRVVNKFDEGGYHGFDFFDNTAGRIILGYIKEFMQSS